MFEKEVILPRSGGKVWLRRRLSDGRADGVDNALLYRLPADAMAAFAEMRDADATGAVTVLTRQGFDPKILLAARRAADHDVVRLVVKRWANVVDAEGEPLEWTSTTALEDLDEADFRFLAGACYDAVREGRADPNAGKGSSGSTSSQEPAPVVSPSTSETPSASTSGAA